MLFIVLEVSKENIALLKFHIVALMDLRARIYHVSGSGKGKGSECNVRDRDRKLIKRE